MKKFLTVAISAVLAFGCISGVAYSVSGAQAESAPREAEHAVYLVPGSYTDKKTGQTVYNTVDGAAKLTDEECEAISTPNVYRFDGETLPNPATTREGVAFNGWWTIEDAEIVYHETAPETSETVFLYADWRAELSQPKDPVNPGDEVKEEIPYYLEIIRAATGEKDIVALGVSGTDIPNAEQLGYGGPIQLYNEWFLLQPGDEIRVYVSRLYNNNEPKIAPQLRDQRYITLEKSGTNRTLDWICCRFNDEKSETGYRDDNGHDYGNYTYVDSTEDPRFAYTGIKATEEHYFRIYIKFYEAGGVMAVYMEKQK